MRKEISIRSSTEFLGEVRKAVMSCLDDLAFSGPEANRLVLAVDEAVANVIEHAYAHDLEGEAMIEITIETDGGKFCVDVLDRGSAFDPTKVELPNIKEHVKLGKRSGLGIFLIRRIMDEVHYDTTGGVNVLRMVKHAAGAKLKGAGDA